MRGTTFLLAMCFMLINGQAPGDFERICRTGHQFRAQHNWIPYVNDTSVGVRGDVKWQILIDQYDYQSLLESTNPLWMRSNIDGDEKQVLEILLITDGHYKVRLSFLGGGDNNILDHPQGTR